MALTQDQFYMFWYIYTKAHNAAITKMISHDIGESEKYIDPNVHSV